MEKYQMDTIKNNLYIYRVYHDKDLLKSNPFYDDGLRHFVNTQHMELGPYLNEFCAFYYFYNELPKNIEYVGLEHYRRTFAQLTPYNYKNYIKVIENKKECIISTVYVNTVQEPYIIYTLNDSRLQSEVVQYCRKYNYSKELDLIQKSYLFIPREMFIMNRKYCDEMIQFVKGCVEYVFKSLNIKNGNDIKKYIDDNVTSVKYYGQHNKYRLFGYLVEYLIDVWIRANMDKFHVFERIRL